MIYRLLLISVVAALLFNSCGGNESALEVTDSNVISENSLGFVDSDVNGDGEGLLTGMPVYSSLAAGTSEKLDRSFENAPPLIPHMTIGFFPIKRDNNICLTCHMPDKAEAVKAVPIPKSHFTSHRPEVLKSGGKYYVNAKDGEVVTKDLGTTLNSAFFNCSQCHVPQANVTVDIKNIFEAVFRDETSKTRSNLDGN